MRLFVVVGLGQFGRNTALSLYAGGGDVIAIDQNEDLVEMVKDQVGQAVCADASDEDALRAIGVNKADTAIVALGESNLEASIMCCTALSDIGVGRIIVRSGSEQHGRILSKVGATRVIYPEKQMGEQLAKSLIASGVLDQVTLPTGQIVAYIRPRHDLVHKTLGECRFNERFRVVVIGIQRPKRHIDDRGELKEELSLNATVQLDDVIEEEDILIVVGSQNQIDQISRRE
jgi:trk system potassium uptake protein TrkA